MTLYNINQTRLDFLEKVESGEIPEEAIADTLASLDGDFEEKVDDTACFIKSLLGEVQAIKSEADSLVERANAKKHKAEKLTDYLLQEMQFAGKAKIETARNKLQIRTNPPAVQIGNVDAFVIWAKANANDLLTYKDPQPSKKAIKQAIKDGKEVPGVELVCGEKLTIK